MKNGFFLKNKQVDKILLVCLPIVTILFSLISGLWWLSNSLSQGVIGIVIFTAFTIDNGIRTFKHKENKRYYYIVFLLPWLTSLLLFGYGFVIAS